MQVMCAFYIENALVGTRKTPPVQVADTASASDIFALIDDRKITTSASHRGSRLSWALVGAGCSNQMQVAQGQGLVRVWYGREVYSRYLRPEATYLLRRKVPR